MDTHPAATLILLRDTETGPEIFIQRRAWGAAFLGGVHVFPGGRLESSDADARAYAQIAGMTDAQASAILSVPSGGLAYWAAAARECFEEAGILLAQDDAGVPVSPACVADLAADRDALNRGEVTFADILARHFLCVPAREFIYFDHWITPPGRPRRFDTRFFVAGAPQGQDGEQDNAEAVNCVWVRPTEALARAARKEIEMANATRAAMNELASFRTVAAALAHARAKGPIETHRPM